MPERRARTAAIALFLTTSMMAAPAAIAQSPAEFFADKTVKIVIGFSTAGTYGQYAQIAARHIRKHVPGTPNVIVQSVRGGGGIVAINHLTHVAPKDGTTLIVMPINMVQDGLLNPQAKYDPRQFEWIGRLMELVQIGVASEKSGLATLADAKTKAASAGGIGASNPTSMNWKILNLMAGTKFNVVSGYKGLPDATLAWERGEVDTVMMNWETAVQRFDVQIKSGKVKPLFVYSNRQMPEVPKGLPALGEFGRNAVEKAFLDIYTVGPRFGRSLAMAAGAPPERLKAWREAFQKMLKDPEFLAEVKTRQMRHDPESGEDVAKYVTASMQYPKSVIDEAKKLYEKLLSDKH
jgi:tripartite-type tricarboxylate transporter receptor subunit TctC